MDQWSFALILVVALMIGAILSYVQHRAYAATVREMAGQHHVKGLALVSGRGKGFWKGVAVILVVNRKTQEVIDGKIMRGASIFARFKEAPDLRGQLEDLRKKFAEDKQMTKALNECVAQLRSMPVAKRLSNPAA